MLNDLFLFEECLIAQVSLTVTAIYTVYNSIFWSTEYIMLVSVVYGELH